MIDVVVLGAGVVGLSAARVLARSGAKVAVVDVGPRGGQGSRAAAGVAIPSVRLLDDPPMFELALAGQRTLQEELEELGEPSLRRGEGILRVPNDPAGRDELERKAAAAPDFLGQWIDRGRLLELEPALAGTPIPGAFHSPRAFMVDVNGYLDRLGARARERQVEVRLGVRALSVEEDLSGVTVQLDGQAPLRAGQLLLAFGAWSGKLAGLPPLPVRPLRGQMLLVRHERHRLSRVVSGPMYLAPWTEGAIVVGATEEEAGFSPHVTVSGMLQLNAAVAKMAPQLRDAEVLGSWAGLRSATSDGRPLIGRLPGLRRSFVATGHGGQGILTGALTGRLIAELISGGAPALVEHFSPTRASLTGSR